MGKYDSDRHHRRSIRLPGYDYTQDGAYFVTISTFKWVYLFGDLINSVMQPNVYGKMVEAEWNQTAVARPYVTLDTFVVMPNHVHGIIIIARQDRSVHLPSVEQFGKPVAASLPTIVRAFKSAATRQINQVRSTPATPVWHRNYYERVIRNEVEHQQIREYIANNPLRWSSAPDYACKASSENV